MNIELPIPVEKRLRERAEALGVDVGHYVLHLLIMGLDITLVVGSERNVEGQRTGRSLNEILAPVHEDVRASGLSDRELDDFGRELIDQVRQSRLTP